MKAHQVGFEVPRRGNLEALFQGGPLVALIKFACELWLPTVAQQFLSNFGSCSQASPRGTALAIVGMQGRTNFADTLKM